MPETANAVLHRAVAFLRDGGEIVCTVRAYREVGPRLSMLRSQGQCPSLRIRRLDGVVSIRRKL